MTTKLFVSNLTGRKLTIHSNNYKVDIAAATSDSQPFSVDMGDDWDTIRFSTNTHSMMVSISNLTPDEDGYYVSVGVKKHDGSEVYMYKDRSIVDAPEGNLIALYISPAGEMMGINIVTNPLFLIKHFRDSLYDMMMRRDIFLLVIVVLLAILIAIPVVYKVKSG